MAAHPLARDGHAMIAERGDHPALVPADIEAGERAEQGGRAENAGGELQRAAPPPLPVVWTLPVLHPATLPVKG
jgi:hypothetical protein